MSQTILVIGGGISGLTTAIEAAEVGYQVVLVEKRPYLGGRVVQMYQYFPKLCPPQCGLEINFRRIRQNPQITWHTLTEVQSVRGEPGNYEVTLRKRPRLVNTKCTACGDCVAVCPVERSSEFDYGLGSTKAIYLPCEMAMPMRYVIDPDVCEGASCAKCVAACRYGAIELDMKPETFSVNVGAIVAATGWEPFDASRLDKLGFGVYPNVVTNIQMERLAAPGGPTDGHILRPSDKQPAKKVAFVQCAGSRDESHLPYCSAVCCAASMKQALALREKDTEAEAVIFYIDVRAQARLEDLYNRANGDNGIRFVKGKVGKITEDPQTRSLLVEAEDVASGRRLRTPADLVVLATGMVPTTADSPLPLSLTYDSFGFATGEKSGSGIIAAGCAKRPQDVASCVRDATGAALRAIQAVRS